MSKKSKLKHQNNQRIAKTKTKKTTKYKPGIYNAYTSILSDAVLFYIENLD